MNKKTYIAPSLESLKLAPATLLAGSNEFSVTTEEITGDVGSNFRDTDWDDED